MTDSQMLDWLEAFVKEHGALLLHDGSARPSGNYGLGILPADRSLRESIEKAAGLDDQEAARMKASA